MIWLASFPRSGNTFVRNILKEVYGLSSGSYHKEDYDVASDCFDHPFVKTHLLPEELPEEYANHSAVYIVRDGRDAIVSMAHHRQDFIAPDSDFNRNLTEAIIAAKGSFFGGWSLNSAQWMERASVVIRFEDLVRSPIEEIEKIRAIYPELPEPRRSKIPTFESQRGGKGSYGVGYDEFDAAEAQESFSKKFFRSGKSQVWKHEMPTDLQIMFWGLHGSVSEKLGYTESGEVASFALNPWKREQVAEKKKVLIVASKLRDYYIDGTKRYADSVIKGMMIWNQLWDHLLDISIKSYSIFTLEDFSKIEKNPQTGFPSNWERFAFLLPRYFQRVLPDFIYARILKIFYVLRIRKLFTVTNRLIKGKVGPTTETQFDLVHFLTPEVPHKSVQKMICTIHDISFELFPQFHTQANIQQHKRSMKALIENEASLLAVSQHTENDVRTFYNLSGTHLKTVYEAVDHERFFPVHYQEEKLRVLAKYGLEESKYFLSLSTIEPRKNIMNALRAFEKFEKAFPEAGIKFVLAGKYGWKSKDLQLDESIIKTGFVPEGDLNMLMGSAISLCYISYYEGFGLPPLEAMRSKTVPIYGNNSSMIELIRECGLATNPDDVDEICKHMIYLFSNEEERIRMENEAYRRSWDFTLERTIKGTIEMYNEKLEIIEPSAVDAI